MHCIIYCHSMNSDYPCLYIIICHNPCAGADQTMSDSDKSIYNRASGKALETVQAHAGASHLKCFFSWFCPYVQHWQRALTDKVQRAWIAVEEKQADYEYIEIQPYHKTKQLLDVNPKGLVPVWPRSRRGS